MNEALRIFQGRWAGFVFAKAGKYVHLFGLTMEYSAQLVV